ncbi:prolyl aminopeptidase [Microbacterium sp. MM2322]|uniref:prolyl aminopeptidase n=1 Tax=Microbacterium sp. MM2322 TaxID=3157631 RepID=UPI0032D59A12
MHPPIQPHASGMLDRPDGARLHWETSGSPSGRGALYLHGGPGGGLGKGGYRRVFDPERYRIVGFDQRGCGASTPWAIDDLEHLDTNTTDALIADVEALREHLGIDRWLVYGVSWGSTLALAYAQAHPERVTEVILLAVTSGARDEIDWITEGVGRIFPEAWAELAALVPPGERVVEAYARMLRDPDPAVRMRAADAWDAWESAHIALSPWAGPGPLHDDERMRANFATLVTHYWSQDCFLDVPILERMDRLVGIPGVLIHGRLDVSGPAVTPWRLHRAWPGSELHILEDEGHGGPASVALAAAAADAFARM